MEDRERAATQHDVFSHPSVVEHWRHLVEIAALVIAAVWGFYVFVYQERIKPAHEPPAVDLTETLRHQPMHGGKEFVWIDLPFKNIGSVDLKIVGMIVNVYGLRFSDQDRVVKQHAGFSTVITHTLPAGKPVFLATHLYHYAETGGQSHFIEAPGVVRTAEVTFAMTSGQYDAARVDLIYCFTRGDNETTYAVQPRQLPDDSFDIQNLADALTGHPGITCSRDVRRVFVL